MKFEHYHDSRKTCHNSNSITIVLNTIKSSVAIHRLTTALYVQILVISKNCLKVRLVSSHKYQPLWLQVHVYTFNTDKSVYFSLKIKMLTKN